MSNLPYFQPERELHFNLGIVLLIIEQFSKSGGGKTKLTIDRLQSFYFLVTRPAFLNKILYLSGKPQVNITDVDYYTVDTLSANVDKLFDRECLRAMLLILSSKDLLLLGYSNSNEILLNLTTSGQDIAKDLDEGYFSRIRVFLDRLSSLQAQAPAKLNEHINTVLRQGRNEYF